MKSFIKVRKQHEYFSSGYANGYVIVPKGHPMHGKHYNELYHIEVHGGLTFSYSVEELEDSWHEFDEEDKDGWVFGFDTAHVGDNLDNCNKEFVENECQNLIEQLNRKESE